MSTGKSGWGSVGFGRVMRSGSGDNGLTSYGREPSVGVSDRALVAASTAGRIAKALLTGCAVIAISAAGGGIALGKGSDRRVVVLDAGHGGRLSGTKTTSGVPESRIVLDIVKHARDLLEKEGLRVVMTRAEDKDVDLDERVSIANNARAAVFVSVHSNYAPMPERSGTETYVLSPTASDEASEALMQLENDEKEDGEGHAPKAVSGGAPSSDAPPLGAPDRGANGAANGAVNGAAADLNLILSDLHRTAAHQDSALLARMLQDSFGKVGGLTPSRGLRQAPFHVLRGAAMPAALVEIGYLSHPAQGAFLASARGQKAAGEALARGILRFLKELRL